MRPIAFFVPVLLFVVQVSPLLAGQDLVSVSKPSLAPAQSAEVVQTNQDKAQSLVASKNTVMAMAVSAPILAELNDFNYQVSGAPQLTVVKKQGHVLTVQCEGITSVVNLNNLTIIKTQPNTEILSPADDYLTSWQRAFSIVKSGILYARFYDIRGGAHNDTYNTLYDALNDLSRKVRYIVAPFV